MNVEEIRFHLRDRWKAVEEIERQELCAMSMETRLKQMNAIWGLGKGLGFSFEPDESEMEVFMRWAKLKEMYEKGLKDGKSLVKDSTK